MANFNKKNKLHMRRIARKGGLKTLENRGKKHFSDIGKKGYRRMKKVLSTEKKSIA